LFPSPCKSFLQIKHGGDVETINIYTVTGNKLIEISKPDKTYTLNTNDWPSGLYFAEILSNNKNIKTIKFIKSE
jgi:hypothetical protein